MALSVCSGCKAAIHWVKMQSGANMPCDPERITAWIDSDAPKSLEPRLKLVTPEGEMIEGRHGSAIHPGTREVIGYIPHWGTCPERAKFKRGRAL